jgi:hypothetical protein
MLPPNRGKRTTTAPALDVVTGKRRCFYFKLPIAGQCNELRSASRLDQPVSDPFRSACLALERLLLALSFPPPESHCCLTVRRECRRWALLLFKEKLSQVSLPVPMGLTRAAPMQGIKAMRGASLVAPDLLRGH